MHRRQLIRTGMLMATGIIMAKYNAWAVEGGYLTIDLSQWKGVIFRMKGQGDVTVTPSEIYKAMKGAQ